MLLDVALARRTAAVLDRAHHEVRLGSICSADHLISAFRPDLVMLGAASVDPVDVRASVQRVRASHRSLILWVGNASGQWVAALEAGADAHLEQPFDDHALEVTVQALVRRVSRLRKTRHHVGRLLVDDAAHLAFFDDQPFTLSMKEFGILSLLAEHAGSVLSKRILLEHLWGFDGYDENLVEVHVCLLRQHVPPGARRMIQTVRGLGYVLRVEAAQDLPA